MKNIKTLILFSIICLLNSCAYNGGGTYGTGLPLGSRATKEAKTGVSYIHFSTRILNSAGRPIQGANVTVLTPQMEETGITDFNGITSVDIITKANEKIEVKIDKGTSSYSAYIMTKEQDLSAGSATFTILDNGKVKISSEQWSQ